VQRAEKLDWVFAIEELNLVKRRGFESFVLRHILYTQSDKYFIIKYVLSILFELKNYIIMH